MKKLAIIGMGPRGLSALEQWLIVSNSKIQFEIHMYETAEFLGAGKIWSLEQPEYNWINISERALQQLKRRPEISYFGYKLPTFPAYQDWVTQNITKESRTQDNFPPRKQMGTYLHERFLSIYEVLKSDKNFIIIKEEVINVNTNNHKICVNQNCDHSELYDEVVLCIGHQPIERDKQLKKWMAHTNEQHGYLITYPYPIVKLSDNKEIKANQNLAIRGFGLAMVDVVRAITIGKGGHFKYTNTLTLESKYVASGKEPQNIIPFSLDGFPLVPKPLNKDIDDITLPSEADYLYFKKELEEVASGQKNVNSINFLTNAIASITASLYDVKTENTLNHSYTKLELKNLVINWFKNEEFNHSLFQNHKLPTIEIIQSFVKMALTGLNLSLDYFIGQVWRHLQPIIYDKFSHAQVSDHILAEIITLDERIKRYSYGPPVESMQQLIALHSCGILNLNYTSNPDIQLVPKGWKLSHSNHSITVEVMVNSILPAPELLKVKSPLVKNLLENDLIQPVHSELGIETHKNGLVNVPESEQMIPLAVLGRLAKGSIIGVDAILECFGTRITDWAEGVLDRNI